MQPVKHGPIIMAVPFIMGCGKTHDDYRPEWIAQPKTDDSLYLYRVGHAMDQPSANAARR